ncbi:aldehyde dehydrogenase family protein [Micromonospora sp. WMMC273]|uniref:aldehyde dehydrogenase family protein n=1 Tax=Micromonospora sp. WMMC273 TaxID=3015157 RepID=UPI0022B6E8EA|nr:aldehyde dehydrogenase family protein [Micromonospora sp. WMMC273]MCZ7478933.1 aldehyde dehydrogenase family protein [Micromonospora sp. WMMC273]MCZ7478994.1 aldehyde dehydrogenase family protein [Micromonospora sp. WMMC273]
MATPGRVPPLHVDQLPIGGRWVMPASSRRVTVVNPATLDEVGSCPLADETDIDRAVTAARQAFDSGPWPRFHPRDRAMVLSRLLDVYAARQAEMADLITAETGSPARFTAQTEHPLEILRFYIDLAGRFPWQEHRGSGTQIFREPVGVVAAVVPWNMPQKTILMKLVPALLAGCTVVVKPAEETPLDALLLADILDSAGLPPGVVSVVPALPETAEYLVAHPAVDKVAFTGSTEVGARIGELCGQRVRRVSLELGGKSPAIVCPDADPARVVDALRTDTFALSGQICSAHTRVLVPHSQLDHYTARIAEMAEGLRVGDPMNIYTDLGPVISRRQQLRVEGYIQDGITSGARLVTGGLPADGEERQPGWWVKPTVFIADNDHVIAREEVFGPVVTLIGYGDDTDAVRIANDSPYGLEAAVWTEDLAHADTLARRLRAGTVRINGAFDVNAPLGGFKASGIGRELGVEGLAGYTEVKAVVSR